LSTQTLSTQTLSTQTLSTQTFLSCPKQIPQSEKKEQDDTLDVINRYKTKLKVYPKKTEQLNTKVEYFTSMVPSLKRTISHLVSVQIN